ncbi:MAG: hypothetical protein GWO22_06560, partial [Actinobacteria bacterium]|nr:hypothetical protein [Actinomycetota bacterium]
MVVTAVGPTEGPTGESTEIGPRNAGAAASATSTRVASVPATEVTARTVSTATCERVIVRGAATEETDS